MSGDRTRAWRQIDAELFRFATTDLHELRVAIMLVLDDASTLSPSLNVDEVVAGLRTRGWDEPIDEAQLQSSLKALVEWRLLDAAQDHAARYSTPEEFERRNLQWSLTARGQAAIAGFLRALEVLRSAISLQPAVLDAMADGLAELARLVDEAGDDSRVTTRLAEVEQHHEALVGNVRQFNGQLQRLLRADATTDDVFLDVKQKTIAYLEEYVRDVERPARRLANSVRRLAGGVIERVLRRALAGANLAPIAGGDPAADWLAERGRRWLAIEVWFAPPDSRSPRIDSLRQIAKTAILQLLRVLDRRWEARRRSASIERDFRCLARWFGEAPAEADAHRLFCAAFGLWSARHAELLDDELVVPRDTAWTDASPVAVAPSLRRSGTQVDRGRARAVADPSRLRAERQRRQAELLARSAALREELITGGVVRLSSFARLPRGPFAELLLLLDKALSAPRLSDGSRRAQSSDAQVEIVLTAPAPGSPPARVETEAGVLLAPDYRIEIQILGRDALGFAEKEAVVG